MNNSGDALPGPDVSAMLQKAEEGLLAVQRIPSQIEALLADSLFPGKTSTLRDWTNDAALSIRATRSAERLRALVASDAGSNALPDVVQTVRVRAPPALLSPSSTPRAASLEAAGSLRVDAWVFLAHADRRPTHHNLDEHVGKDFVIYIFYISPSTTSRPPAPAQPPRARPSGSQLAPVYYNIIIVL